MALVIIDEPKGTYYGGVVAGPVMHEVLANALPYLGIEPVYNDTEKALEEVQQIKVPQFIGLSIKEAQALAKENDINVVVDGEGTEVYAQFPLEGEIINKTSKIILYTH